MTTPSLPERLRYTASNVRNKPVALAEFIPLIQQAADEIDRLSALAADRAATPELPPSAAWLLAECVSHLDVVTPKGLRAKELAREVLKAPCAEDTPAEDVLRRIASYLGAGGYNAPAVDAKVFHDKIMWGIEEACKNRAADRAATAPDGLDAFDQSIADDLKAELGIDFHIMSKPTLASMLIDAHRALTAPDRAANSLQSNQFIETVNELHAAIADLAQESRTKGHVFAKGYDASKVIETCERAHRRVDAALAALSPPAAAATPIALDRAANSLAAPDWHQHQCATNYFAHAKCDCRAAAPSVPPVGVGREAEHGEPGKAWIVVKEHVWDHEDGGRPTLAYLWPAEFQRQVFPSAEEASAFIKKQQLPLGWVRMELTMPAAPTAEPAVDSVESSSSPAAALGRGTGLPFNENARPTHAAPPPPPPPPPAPRSHDQLTQRAAFEAQNFRDAFGQRPSSRERELMFMAWETCAALAAIPASPATSKEEPMNASTHTDSYQYEDQLPLPAHIFKLAPCSDEYSVERIRAGLRSGKYEQYGWHANALDYMRYLCNEIERLSQQRPIASHRQPSGNDLIPDEPVAAKDQQ